MLPQTTWRRPHLIVDRDVDLDLPRAAIHSQEVLRVFRAPVPVGAALADRAK